MSNVFESGAQKCIPAVLIYARHGTQVLMMHRDGRKKEVLQNSAGSYQGDDFHLGNYNGLGGKLDPGESPTEAASREFFEESGIKVKSSDFKMVGVLQFPNFKPHKNEDWIVFVFSTQLESAIIAPITNQEGRLEWVQSEKLLDLPLWAGDRHFLPLVLKHQKFMGTFWYAGRELRRFELFDI